MTATAITTRHLVEREAGTVLVVLVGADALGVREAQLQTLQDLAPTKVIGQAGIDVRIGRHGAGVVAIVLEYCKRVVLVLHTGAIAGTIGGNIVAVDLLRNIARTGQHQVVVLLIAGTADLQHRFILLAVVTADSEVGRQVVGDLDIDAGTVVPAVVVELAEVTVLLEIADTTEIADLIRRTADIDGVAHGETGLPILVEQVVIQTFHGFQLVGLEECCGLVQTGVGGVGSCNGIVQATVVVGTEHLGTGHLVGETEVAAIADAGSTLLTLLRGDEDDTVGSTGTIDGG